MTTTETTSGAQAKKRQSLVGVVVSDKMEKTVVVKVTRLRKHPLYKKFMKRSKRYKAHDERNEYHIGDRVIIEASKPISRDKRWKVVSKI